MDDLQVMLMMLQNDKSKLYLGGHDRMAKDIEAAMEFMKSQQTEIKRLKETLRKKQSDIDTICNENSELRHRIHDVQKDGDGDGIQGT